jgi:hypothetical protein
MSLGYGKKLFLNESYENLGILPGAAVLTQLSARSGTQEYTGTSKPPVKPWYEHIIWPMCQCPHSRTHEVVSIFVNGLGNIDCKARVPKGSAW